MNTLNQIKSKLKELERKHMPERKGKVIFIDAGEDAEKVKQDAQKEYPLHELMFVRWASPND